MRIGIEAQRIFRTKKHGMDIVALEQIRALQKLDQENLYYVFVKKGDDHSCLKETANFRIVEVPGVTYADWEQFFLPLYATRYKLDILHCTSNTAPILYRGRMLLTLHDVIFLESGTSSANRSWYQSLGRYYRQWISPVSIRKASHVITVSNFERERIGELLQMSTKDISVVYNAFSAHFLKKSDAEARAAVRKRYQLPEQYLFYIGNTDPKKNIHTTLKAYAGYVGREVSPLPLVIADISESFLQSVLNEAGIPSLRPHLYLTGYIRNTDLPCIYSGASLFLYPSLRESFGIPVLESMACGTPVITSNRSALPEITGEAAVLVDPSNEEKISDAISATLNDGKKVSELIGLGYERIRHFSWGTAASRLLGIYQTI